MTDLEKYGLEQVVAKEGRCYDVYFGGAKGTVCSQCPLNLKCPTGKYLVYGIGHMISDSIEKRKQLAIEALMEQELEDMLLRGI